MEDTQLTGQRFLVIVRLISIAYTRATDQGKRIRRKQFQQSVGRGPETGRTQKRHSDFWTGLSGQ